MESGVGTLGIFRVGPADADLLGSYTGEELKSRELQKLPDFYAAVRIQVLGRPLEPFVMATLKAPQLQNVQSEIDNLKMSNSVKYGRERTEVERGIMRACGLVEKSPSKRAA